MKIDNRLNDNVDLVSVIKTKTLNLAYNYKAI